MSLDQSFEALATALAQKIQTVQGSMKPAEVWAKYGDQLTAKTRKPLEQVQEAFLVADPTQNKKHIEWLVTSYLDGGIALLEDLGQASRAIESFSWLVKNSKIRPDDITKYQNSLHHFCGIRGCKRKNKDMPGLEDFLDDYKIALEARDANSTEKQIKETEARMIANTDSFRLIHPMTSAASCKYGANTRWCTAGKKSSNEFEHYNNQGPLYILIPKQPKYPTEKYQLHFIEKEADDDEDKDDTFMDDKHEPVKLLLLLNRFPELKTIPEIKNNIKIKDVLEDINFVKQLLPTDTDIEGALITALNTNMDINVIQLLINERGKDINIQKVLTKVLEFGNIESNGIFELLIKTFNTNIDMQNLLRIAIENHAPIGFIQILINNGANVKTITHLRKVTFFFNKDNYDGINLLKLLFDNGINIEGSATTEDFKSLEFLQEEKRRNAAEVERIKRNRARRLAASN